MGVTSSYQRPVTQKMWWLSSFYAQWSPDCLYGSERLTIGGENSVRGYKEQYLSGDVGGYLRNELDQSAVHPACTPELTTLALTAGGSRVTILSFYPAGRLRGSSLGLGTRNAHVSTQLSLEYPVELPQLS